MSPPVEPRLETVQVTFVDFSAAIGVSEFFTPLTTSYPTFLSLLNALSGSVAHKLQNLAHQYLQGQGFTLSDGGWWYRFVKRVNTTTSEADVGEPWIEKGPWTLLDCLFGYEKLVSELCLGVKWSGASVEIQHNLQKKRDEAGIDQTQGTTTDTHIDTQIFHSQITSAQVHRRHDSALIEPCYALQDEPRTNTERCDNVSAVKDAFGSGYDSIKGIKDAGHHDDGTFVYEGQPTKVDESNKNGKLNTKYTSPLIVSSPVVGVVPPDDDEEDSFTAERGPTPLANLAPEIAEPIVAQPNTGLAKGPGGITYLPAYQAKASEPPSDMSFNSQFVSRLPADPEPKFYPPPPRATGSPSDKYRQVPRSGGAIRKPNHQPYRYQYGGPEQQLGGVALPSTHSQQQHFPFSQQNMGQPPYKLPGGTFNQSRDSLNKGQRLGFQQRQSFHQQSSPQGVAGGRARGKRDVRKARGDYSKNSKSNRYGTGNRYQYGNRPSGSGNSPRFPLDPALEVNYRNYNRQSNYNGGYDHYSNQHNVHNQGRFQDPYGGYGNGYGKMGGSGDAYQSHYPTPLAFDNNSNYGAASAFAIPEPAMMPEFSAESRMATPAHNAGASTQEKSHQPFVLSPLAQSFVPRPVDVQQEQREQYLAGVESLGHDQVQSQNYAMALDTNAFQYQLHGYGMLPLGPAPFATTMPMPTSPDLMNRAWQPFPYARPRPAASTPPMGEFSPPNARKNRKQAKKNLEKALAGSSTERMGGVVDYTTTGLDEGNDSVFDDAGADFGEFDDGDGVVALQSDDSKKKSEKPKQFKNKQLAGSGFATNDEMMAGGGERREGGEEEGQYGMEAPAPTPTTTTTNTTTSELAEADAEAKTQGGMEEDEMVVDG